MNYRLIIKIIVYIMEFCNRSFFKFHIRKITSIKKFATFLGIFWYKSSFLEFLLLLTNLIILSPHELDNRNSMMISMNSRYISFGHSVFGGCNLSFIASSNVVSR